MPSPAAGSIVFGAERVVLERDPATLADRLQAVLPLRDLAQIGPAKGFQHRSIVAAAGSVQLLAGCHTPLHGRADESSRVMFLLTAQGEAQYQTQGTVLPVQGDLCGLFLPGSAMVAQTDAYNGIIFSAEPEELLTAAAAVAGLPQPTAAMRKRLQKPEILYPDDSDRRTALQNLRQAIGMVDLAAPRGMELAVSLGIDDLLYRCMALLLFPELSAEADAMEGDAAKRRVLLAEIEAYLMANLASPIRLSELESRFHVSRRTLQQWFSRRHGCGPIQWVRRRRLYAARRKLLDRNSAQVSIQSISEECGYVSAASFSRDFKACFQMKPSDLDAP
jgi:AraC-like DNA-binding protein